MAAPGPVTKIKAKSSEILYDQNIHVDGANWSQGEVSLRGPLLGPPGMALGEVLFPLLGQSESGVADVKGTHWSRAVCGTRGSLRTMHGGAGPRMFFSSPAGVGETAFPNSQVWEPLLVHRSLFFQMY